MTDVNPSFDTVHPSGHILVRSCRGGYMHSVALSEEAMETDAETLAQGILLTADVSCLKALLEVRNEIVAAGHTPSAEVPTPNDLDAAIEKLLSHKLRRRDAARQAVKTDFARAPARAARSFRRRGRARYRWVALWDWGRTTLARGPAGRALRRVAAATQNQPWVHATQAAAAAQFTG